MTSPGEQPEPFAVLPEPPYWAVVFSSRRAQASPGQDDGYAAAAELMVQLAQDRQGFLGIESARDTDGFGVTVSYWADLEAIRGWRDDAEHAAVRARGRAQWYEHYELRVARVERAYGWDAATGWDAAAGRPAPPTPAP